MKYPEIRSLIAGSYQKGDLNKSDLVQIIALCGNILELKSVSDYAKENNMSYNGVKNHRTIKTILGSKMVID